MFGFDWQELSVLQCEVCILVFSVTDRHSFHRTAQLRLLLRETLPHTPIILVGNKSDLVRSREISTEGRPVFNLRPWATDPIIQLDLRHSWRRLLGIRRTGSNGRITFYNKWNHTNTNRERRELVIVICNINRTQRPIIIIYTTRYKENYQFELEIDILELLSIIYYEHYRHWFNCKNRPNICKYIIIKIIEITSWYTAVEKLGSIYIFFC